MKGSPNKFTGSMASTAGALQPAQGQDINPYGDLNPGAGTGLQRSQAEGSLAPVLASPRPMDQAAMSDPYSSPGATVDPKQAMNAETIFGQKGQRQALMNLGTPLYDKGHASDYDGHTHRKKGGSYKEGDYMDETDMETSYPKLYTQDVGEISKDKKGQFMVSKNKDYNPTKIDTIRPLKGKTFKTTLDNEVQVFASKLLQNVSGAACVMDIYNGDIISMVSSPTFDPNLFIHGINQREWDKILKNRDKPMLNKAISGLYPPGSTIKTLTAISALENDIVSPNLVVRCKGFIDLHGERFHCWKKKGHGLVGMRAAIKKSCDIYFYEVSRRLGIDRLAATAKKFGLGKKVLKDYKEEKAGVVPNTKWKIKELGKNWYIGETLHSGIGQGYFLTTPLQLSLMTAQIANGGYKIKPRILVDKNDKVSNLQKYLNHKNSTPGNIMPTNDRIFNFGLEPLFRNQENINLVKDAMFAATNEIGGTSYRSRHRQKEFMFAGKTGSSQIKRFTPEQREAEVKQDSIPYQDRDHAWFVAFAPVKDPRYAISVLVEHGGSGSKAAAPLAKKIIKKVLERHQSRTSYLNRVKENV